MTTRHIKQKGSRGSSPTTAEGGALLGELGLVRREDYAAARGVSLRTVRRDEVLRRGPAPIRIGRSVYYKKAQILEMIDAQLEAQQKPARGRASGRRYAPGRAGGGR